MQDKDFDQFIRQAMDKFPEPAYNPADWDSMEDRLHNLNGPQAQPSGAGNPLRKFGFGKAAMVVSTVVVTTVNAVLFVKSENNNNQQAPVQTGLVLTDNNAAAGTEVQATEEEMQATAPVTEQGTVYESGKEMSELAANQSGLQTASTAALSASPAPENLAGPKTTVNKSGRKTTGSVKSSTVAAAGNNTSAWVPGAVWTGTNSNGSRNNPAGGYYPVSGSAGNNTAAGCAGNNQPEVSFTILNSDTIYGSRIALSACQAGLIRLITHDKDTDQLTVTSNIGEMLPGATVALSKAAQPVIAVQVPSTLVARQQPYAFTIWLQDNHCPNVAPRPYTFTLSVTPAFTVSVNGITNIEKGQWTMLEAVGAPEGSTYKWTGKGLTQALKTAKISVNPAETVTYAVQVTAPGGCTYSDSVKVAVAKEQPGEAVIKAKYIPNIFTPNGDGANDYFEVRLPEDGPYSLVVFDRWSKKVYSSQKYQNNWEAENLPIGTYFYVITTAQGNKTYKGWVEVVR